MSYCFSSVAFVITTRTSVADLQGFTNYSVHNGITFVKYGDQPYDKTKPTVLHIPGLEFSGLSLAQYVLGNNTISKDFNLIYTCINNTFTPSLDHLVYAIDSHIQEHKYENVTVVGESSGAIVALHLGLMAEIERVVLINSATAFVESNAAKLIKSSVRVNNKWEYRTLCLLYLVLIQQHNDLPSIALDKNKRLVMAMMLTNLFLFSKEVLVDRVNSWILGSSFSLPVSARNMLYPVPVLLVASKKDEMFDSVGEAKRLKRLLPHSSIVHVSACGHLPSPERLPLYRLIQLQQQKK